MLLVIVVDELQVPDDPIARHCDEHLARVEIGVELRGGILRHREQRSQLAARARVEIDVYPGGIEPGEPVACGPL